MMVNIESIETGSPALKGKIKGKMIFQVIPTLETGGAERTAVDMVEGIVTAGGHALVASRGGRLVKAVEAAGGKHITLPLDAKFRLDHHFYNGWALRKLCRDHNVDLIHARSRAPAFAALAASRTLNIPFLTTYHGIYSENSALKRWYNSVMVAGDAVIANSEYTRGIIQERYQVPDEKIHVVHRGTDLHLFDPRNVSAEQSAALRQQWGLPADRPIIVLLGRLTSWKGHMKALETLSLLQDKVKPLPFMVFVGGTQNTDYENRLRQKITNEHLDKDVMIAGHTDDVPAALSLATMVIAPSTRPEAFGRTIAEASAFGLPVIGFDHGGATETIACPPLSPDEERTGYRVPVGDVPALAMAMQKLLTLTPNERQAMGGRGRTHIAARFSKQNMVQKTLHVYATLL